MKRVCCLVLLLALLCGPLCGCEQLQYLFGSSQADVSSDPASAASSAAERPSQITACSPISSVVSAAQSTVSTTVTVTVPEGYSMAQTFALLEEKGVCTAEKLFDAAENYDFSYYPAVAAIADDEHRCFLLEGYLFPDTYEFYYGQKPQDVIGVFLRNFAAKVDDEISRQAAALGYSVDEILTIASVIEEECGVAAQRAGVSAVLHNRLAKGMKLQCDVTIHYVEYWIKPYISGDIDRYNEYYNTYKCAALPAGPICSPGLSAIRAALHPADSDALYFCASSDGTFYYATTLEEHQENVKQLG